MVQQYQALHYQHMIQYQQMMQMQQQMQYQRSMLDPQFGCGYMVPIMQSTPGNIPVDLMIANTIEELKKYVMIVDTEYVKRVIDQARVVPREMAFTSLIQLAGKARQTDKAIIIFEAMKGSKHGVKPNMYSYTALISALAKVGDWESAERYFGHMKEAAKSDPDVTPNRVTFSSMISVYEKAKKYDSALRTFEEQLEANIQPDLITYISVLAACQASREKTALRQAVTILEKMHGSNLIGSRHMYLNLLSACTEHWEIALDIFRCICRQEMEITPSMYNAVMESLFLGGQKDHAVELAKQAHRNSIRLNHIFFYNVLKLCSDAGDSESSDAIRSIMLESDIQMSPQCAGLIVSAHMQSNKDIEAIEKLSDEFKSMGVFPVLPARKKVVEHEALTADVQMHHRTCELSDVSTQSELDTIGI
jgi:pentatricopeptide repeat protein